MPAGGLVQKVPLRTHQPQSQWPHAGQQHQHKVLGCGHGSESGGFVGACVCMLV